MQKVTDDRVISIEGLTKVFPRKDGTDLIALDSIDLSLRKGEVLGIIGANGSGKSTLLRIMSSLLKPNNGKVIIHGRVSSLLDIGWGFHPDLTGRENVYLKGNLLSLSKHEIDSRIDQIVSFSGLQEFIDEPLKTYSNGMFLRLGFSLSVSFDYDIIILDELLSVGDSSFREKCYSEIHRAAKLGKTILFVSHSLAEVAKLSTKCLMLEKGRVFAFGECEDVLKTYLDKIERGLQENDSGNGCIKVLSTAILDADTGQCQNQFIRSQKIRVEIMVQKFDDLPMELMVSIVNQIDYTVLSDSMAFRKGYQYSALNSGKYCYIVTIPNALLNVGHYRMVCMASNSLDNVWGPMTLAEFSVQPEPWELQFDWVKQSQGVRPNLAWSLKEV